MRNAPLALSLALSVLLLAPALSPARAQSSAPTAALAFAAAPAAPGAADPATRPDAFSDAELALIRERLRDMACIIPRREHPIVESYLRGYILRNREKSERILGRIPTYFPLIESALREAGLPDDLKYLAVVESALVARASSRAGAGGLWQFMPTTGASFGLRIDDAVDQRADPVLATEAAMQFLRDEYDRFQDWPLVLAAYNGGPGRVRRAIARVGAADFWKIHPHLPRETRNYVPAFVAAKYLHLYGHLHGLSPVAPSLDEQLLLSVACPQGVSLGEVAQATQLPLSLVRELNPHCLRDYLPAGARANCRVPARVADALELYLRLRTSEPDGPYVAAVRARPISVDDTFDTDGYYEQHQVYVDGGRSIGQVARELGISEHHLRVWNPDAAHYSPSPRELTVYRFGATTAMITTASGQYLGPHVHRRTIRRPLQLTRLSPKPALSPLAVSSDASDLGEHSTRAPNRQHTVRRYETLIEIWKLYSDTMTWSEFTTWNAIDSDDLPVPGQNLLVRS